MTKSPPARPLFLHRLIACSLFPLLLLASFFVVFQAQAETLLEDTVWEGTISLEDDIIVPPGITLTVRKNTTVNVIASDSTKTDPEYMSPLAEITIRGVLRVEGTPDSPVVFRIDPSGRTNMNWAGIIIDGGSAELRSCVIRDAETGVWIPGGRVELAGSQLVSNRYGMVVQGKAAEVHISDTRIAENEYGILAVEVAEVARSNVQVENNSRKDIHSLLPADFAYEFKGYEADSGTAPREISDEVLMGDVVWQGRVVVNNRVRIPEDSRLIILPGTIVEFRKHDSNGDGIGENGLMLQGVLVAKGTEEKPILFRSAEADKGSHDWDAVNIINSDGARNVIEYCQFENAYRGVHFHFSNVAVLNSVFRQNTRGVQFQESTVELRWNTFYDNTSAIQARDSEILFSGNEVVKNVFGANFLRAHLDIRGNTFGGNLDFGLKVREGYPIIRGNIMHHNRFGLMFSDTTYGTVEGNVLVQNGETGLSVRTGANMEISGNFIQGSGLSGISLRDTLALVQGNHLSQNGERGIGVISFKGSIARNTIVNNQLYAIAAEDGADVLAPSNWYGEEADLNTLLFDKSDDPSRGRIQYRPVAGEPPAFSWPLATVPVDLTWSGNILVPQPVAVPTGATLTIEPGSTVFFARDAGMKVRGGLMAAGKVDRRIRFTAEKGNEPGSWGEIAVEYSEGSRFSNCDVEYATWGIHSHFTALRVIGCTFRNNGGGIRFRSGPVFIGNSLFSDNDIGIRAYLGVATISGNIVSNNAKGIFVREKGGGLMITRNNIHDNTDYNVWVGDFNTEDIKAPENWWGTDTPEETFFDARREPGIGTVLYEPPLTAPENIVISHEEL